MKSSRKEFLKQSAYMAALSAVGITPSIDPSSKQLLNDDKDEDWLELSVANWGKPRPKRVKLMKMMGVHKTFGFPGGSVESANKFYNKWGLKWSALEGIVPIIKRAQVGAEGKDEDIENFIKVIKACSKDGPDVIIYGWAPYGWLRTNKDDHSARGGALVSSFNYDNLDQKTFTKYGRITKEQNWKNLEYFLKAVVPVAEKYDIKLALHPNDPAVPRVGGISRIITSFEAYKRVVEIYPSPSNGVCMHQGILLEGSISESPRMIRYFGERNLINAVHFRNSRGTAHHFREAWHDNGENDMYECMQAYYDVGFRGPMRPDHVPTIPMYEENDHPGYMNLGLLFAIGYIRGLMEAVAKSSA